MIGKGGDALKPKIEQNSAQPKGTMRKDGEKLVIDDLLGKAIGAEWKDGHYFVRPGTTPQSND